MEQLQDELIAAEVVLLQAINYKMRVPTIRTFLSSILQRHHTMMPMDKPLYFLCSYLVELCLLNHKTALALLPGQQQQMAAAVYMYALVLLKRPLGHSHTVTLYQLSQLCSALFIIVETHSLISKNPSGCAVYVEYAAPGHLCVTTIPPVTLEEIAAMAMTEAAVLQCEETMCAEPLSPACSSSTAVVACQ